MPVRVLEWVLADEVEDEGGQGQWVLGTATDSYVDTIDSNLYYVVDFGDPEGKKNVLMATVNVS